jgi:hypothetical protein
MLSSNEILQQSKSAQKQWGPTWLKHAAINGERYKKDGHTIKDFLFRGTGKKIVCCGLAPSFEKNFHILQQYRNNVDVAIVDKALGPCLDHGIRPNYVFLADAMVSYEQWCEPWVKQTERITLISNVCANPKWQQNWKGPVYFVTNKDNIETEKIYGPASGCNDLIPAASNVGNMIVVFATQLMNYDEYILMGYEFVFREDRTYYAFSDSEKRYWMKHGVVVDSEGTLSYVSQNIAFTGRWLADFWNAELRPKSFKMVNCSGGTTAPIPVGNLERKLRHAKRRQLTEDEKKRLFESQLEAVVIPASPDAGKQLQDTLVEKKFVGQVIVRYYKPEVMQWLNENYA